MEAERGPVFTGKFSSAILRDCAVDIARELRTRDIGHEIVVEGLATRILVETLRAWPRQQVERCALDLTPRLPRRDFIRAYEFMRWCRKDAFRLQYLCQFLGTSEERFTRLFHSATQSTPANFYNQLLMERSCELLRDAGVAVKTIGYELGFKTSSHFTRCQTFGPLPGIGRVSLLIWKQVFSPTSTPWWVLTMPMFGCFVVPIWRNSPV